MISQVPMMLEDSSVWAWKREASRNLAKALVKESHTQNNMPALGLVTNFFLYHFSAALLLQARKLVMQDAA